MKDLAVVLGTETVTVILDDTISVWPEHQHNLMQVTDRHLKHLYPAGGFAVRSWSETWDCWCLENTAHAAGLVLIEPKILQQAKASCPAGGEVHFLPGMR